MTTSRPQESPEELRAELERLEREIAELQRVAREMREQLADHSDGSEVGPDRTEALTMAEEQEAIAAVLQARRQELQRRLAAS
ncbi:MAG TPA: hypothetical protein VL856_00665 [Acidimicrobiia bacterium]|jgi:hypothetical protein|nr:hypothetical protein [Acidimicrobiia bacterium]